MGLDQPLADAILPLYGSVLRGDFGTSYNTGNRVIDDLKDRLPATLEFAGFGIAFGLLAGLPLGIVAAVYRGRPIDHLTRAVRSGRNPCPHFGSASC